MLWVAAPALGQQDASATVLVVEVTGLVDPIQADFLEGAVEEAESVEAEALVIRLDSRGAAVDDARIESLVRRLRRSVVPVAVWIGPSRDSTARGGAFKLFMAADVRAMAPGASAGGGSAEDTLGGEVVSARRASQLGIAGQAATLGDFIVGLNGHEVDGTEIAIPTEVVDRPNRPPQQQLAESARVRFEEPSLLAQMLHAVATPSAALLLLAIGLLLVVFELYTAGIGVAAGVAALSLLLAFYGLGVLPTRWWALGLVLFGIAGFAVDVQAGAPRAWTVIGTVSVLAGSLWLFDGASVPLVTVAVVVAGAVVFMVAAMPSVVRTRFATPTVGRESMIGEEGEALSDVDPEGVVKVRDATWPARTNRATPLRSGDAVRVAAIDGLLLEVEPLEGAARDYRD